MTRSSRSTPSPCPLAGEPRQLNDLGFLALSVDFSSSASNPFVVDDCDYDDDQQMHPPSHLIEASLCIRRQEQQQQHRSLQAADADHCDRQSSPGCDTSSASSKRRLIYERFDKFPLEIGSILIPSASSDPRRHQLGRIEKQMKFLPFGESSFDACFGLNLLDARVTNGQQLTIERQQQQQPADSGATQMSCSLESDNVVYRQELEQNWLKLERLTEELRLALLGELGRVVKAKGQWFAPGHSPLRTSFTCLKFIINHLPNETKNLPAPLSFSPLNRRAGKIMLTVFACECSNRRTSQSANSNTKNDDTANQSSPLDLNNARPANVNNSSGGASGTSECKQRRRKLERAATTTGAVEKVEPACCPSSDDKDERPFAHEDRAPASSRLKQTTKVSAS